MRGRRQVRVVFSKAHNRVPHPTLEAALEAEWQRRLAANPRLFAALKFRFVGIGPDHTISLGLTDYKEFIGTNMAPHAATLLSDGETHHGSRGTHMVRGGGERVY